MDSQEKAIALALEARKEARRANMAKARAVMQANAKARKAAKGKDPIKEVRAPLVEIKEEPKPKPKLVKAKPPPNRANEGRHQLRDPDEYPADDLGSPFFIERPEFDRDQRMIKRGDFPEGYDLQWVATKIWGQPQPSMRAEYERKGWVAVMHGDFDGRYDGRFLPMSYRGEIEKDGLVLMARPMSWTFRARLLADRDARGVLTRKAEAIRGGHIEGISPEATQHQSALDWNKLNRGEMERVHVEKRGSDKDR